MNKRIVIVAVPEEKFDSYKGCIFYGGVIDCVHAADAMEIAGLGDCEEDSITYQIAPENTDSELPMMLQSQAS